MKKLDVSIENKIMSDNQPESHSLLQEPSSKKEQEIKQVRQLFSNAPVFVQIPQCIPGNESQQQKSVPKTPLGFFLDGEQNQTNKNLMLEPTICIKQNVTDKRLSVKILEMQGLKNQQPNLYNQNNLQYVRQNFEYGQQNQEGQQNQQNLEVQQNQQNQEYRDQQYLMCFGLLDSRDTFFKNFCKVFCTLLVLPFILLYLFFKELVIPCLKLFYKKLSQCLNFMMEKYEDFMDKILACFEIIFDAISRCIRYLCTPVCKFLAKVCEIICDTIGNCCNLICECIQKCFDVLSKCCQYTCDKLCKCLNYIICNPLGICCKYIGTKIEACCEIIGQGCEICCEAFCKCCDIIYFYIALCCDFSCDAFSRCCVYTCKKIESCLDFLFCTPLAWIYNTLCLPCFTYLWLFVVQISHCIKKCTICICEPICKCLGVIFNFLYEYIIIPIFKVLKALLIYIGEFLGVIAKYILLMVKAIGQGIIVLVKGISSIFTSKRRQN